MFTIEHVLCPVDFSPSSRRALGFAVQLWQWFGARISVLYVHRPTIPLFCAAPVAVPSLADVPMGEQERAGILAGMERYVASERALGVPIDLVVRDSPKVARTIVEVATEIGADVIAMSTEGRSGVRRLLLGSVAEGVLRLADCPVLTVTPRLPRLEGDAPALDRVLCAVESLEHVESALRHAIALAEMSGARLTIAHIVRLPLELVAPDATLSDQRLVKFREARVRIDALIASMHPRCPVDPILLAGSPLTEINRLAAEQQAGVLVIGGRRAGRKAALRRDLTEQLVRQAPCPVLTV